MDGLQRVDGKVRALWWPEYRPVWPALRDFLMGVLVALPPAALYVVVVRSL